MTLNNTSAGGDDDRLWDDTSPTSTVFTVGSLFTSGSYGAAHIAYCFHSVEGYCKVGSYVGNGNADGTFVYTGFRPAWLLVKGTNSNQWFIYDTTRALFNQMTNVLYPAENYAEASGSNPFDFISNGFKLRTTSGGRNASGQTYIYLAFAEAPFKFANAR